MFQTLFSLVEFFRHSYFCGWETLVAPEFLQLIEDHLKKQPIQIDQEFSETEWLTQEKECLQNAKKRKKMALTGSDRLQRGLELIHNGIKEIMSLPPSALNDKQFINEEISKLQSLLSKIQKN